MIKTYAYDVEILPNFFCITITDVGSYLDIFKDCVNAKDKPIPLTQILTVAEIKKRLDTVERKKFYITDTDDSQLLQMLGYINSMRPHYEVDDDGNQIPIRSDWFGYNSNAYDKLMIAGLLMFANQTNSTKELITKLYELSKHIIDLQDNEEMRRHDYSLSLCNKYPLPYTNVDIMTIFALNKVGSTTDDDGNKHYFGKGLKQTSINLQWYELLEYELPPISDKDVEFYWKNPIYKNIPADKLNKLISKWDRYMLPEWIEPTLHYNDNDVFIVCEMIRLFMDEIRLRYSIAHNFKIDCLSSSRSNIADKLFVSTYSKRSGLTPEQWRGKKTDRTAMSFKRVIFDFIKFKTKPLQELLEEMKSIILYSTGKKALKEIAPKYPNLKYLKTDTNSGWFEVAINKTIYTIATGGLHTKDIPRELKSKIELINDSSTGEEKRAKIAKIAKSKDDSIWNHITDDSYIYVHWDISSFYPSIMVEYEVAPKHLDKKTFVGCVRYYRDTRITAKHSKEKLIDGVPPAILAQALKIVINSIYGKFSFEKGDIYDRLCTLIVTINGQLMIMMLCEELELNGIEVASANTDGIVVKLHKYNKSKFDEIAKNWMNLTGLSADSEEYLCYINRDINNYYVEELNGKSDAKGDLNEFMYIKDLSKGYDMPIVAHAVINYFVHNIPVLETLYASKNILDFCKTQNVGRQFHVEFTKGNHTEQLQRFVRFYVTNQGGVLEKVNDNTQGRNNMCAGKQVAVLNTLDDTRIEFRNIDYKYYYEAALKIIDPIKLNISPNQKGDRSKGLKSGKVLIKQMSGQYNSLFDDADF